MSINTTNGILDITGAVVRVSKMEFKQATGFDTVFNNIARNTILLSDSDTYETTTTYHNWALKLPNAWVFEADVYLASGTSGGGDHTFQLNFYNNVNTAIANGYTLGLDGTSLTLSYDGTQISTATLSTSLNDDAWHKLFVLFERDTFAVAIDGKPEYTFTDSVLRDRVYNDDTGYVVFYHEAGVARKIKNLKFVNGDKWIRESGSSNIAYIGGSVGIGTDAPKHTLDVLGNANVGTLTVTSVSGDGSGLSLIQSSNVSDFASNVTRIGTLETDLDSNVSRIGTLESGDLTIGGEKTFSSNLEVGTANLFVDTTTGRVGVGTESPGTLLELSKATGSATISPTELRLSTTTNAADWNVTDPWARLSFYTDDVTGDAPGVMASVGAVASSADGGENTRLAFFTAEPHLERMCIDRYGSVGIGTTSPNAVLDIEGLKTRFNYEYRYQDYWTSNNNQTLTIPVSGSSARGLMFVEAKVIQVAANSSSNRVARVKGMISNYHTGNYYMTVIEGENVSAFETYMVGTSGSAAGTFTMKYRPQGGYQQSVVCRLYLKIWTGGYTGSLGSLTRTDTGSNTALTAPTFDSAETTFGGNVGIGTASPGNYLHIQGDSVAIASDPSVNNYGQIELSSSSYAGWTNADRPSNLKIGIDHRIGTFGGAFIQGVVDYINAGIPLLLCPKGGNVGIGTANPSQKLTIEGTGVSSQTRINGDGYVGRYYYSGGDNGSSIHFTNNAILPSDYNFALNNGGIELGWATYRWAQIYSTSSTISTSDRNKKQDITDISSSERKVASKIIPLLKTFRMKDAVAKKGDDARIHTGVIAQDLIAVFDSEGLDAHRYGLFCYDEKWTVDGEHELSEIVYEKNGAQEYTNDDGEVVKYTKDDEGVQLVKRKTGSFANKDTPGAVLDSTMYSIRYEELLCFIASAMVTNEELQAEKAKLTSVLARLDALENP